MLEHALTSSALAVCNAAQTSCGLWCVLLGGSSIILPALGVRQMLTARASGDELIMASTCALISVCRASKSFALHALWLDAPASKFRASNFTFSIARIHMCPMARSSIFHRFGYPSISSGSGWPLERTAPRILKRSSRWLSHNLHTCAVQTPCFSVVHATFYSWIDRTLIQGQLIVATALVGIEQPL